MRPDADEQRPLSAISDRSKSPRRMSVLRRSRAGVCSWDTPPLTIGVRIHSAPRIAESRRRSRCELNCYKVLRVEGRELMLAQVAGDAGEYVSDPCLQADAIHLGGLDWLQGVGVAITARDQSSQRATPWSARFPLSGGVSCTPSATTLPTASRLLGVSSSWASRCKWPRRRHSDLVY